MTLKRFIATCALAGFTLAAMALPTVDAVKAEVQRGNYAQAEVMMQDVVAAKPGSARAHYVYAEILAHNKRFDQAATEVATARRLDPALGFADPAQFKTLEQLLQREQAAARPAPRAPMAPAATALRPAPAPASSGIPGWAWALGLGGLAAVLWSVFSRRQQPAVAPMGMGGGAMASTAPAGYGGGPAYGPGPGYAPAPSGGPGLMGVGLAAAGGVAAGMLAEKLLQGGHQGAAYSGAAQEGNGLVPGMFDNAPADDAAARELEQRPVDFGSGGNDWGGDAGGGSDDNGGGW